MVPFLVWTLIGLSLFYLQNLALFPYVQLRLLSLLVFYVGLRPSFAQAFSLALCLGLLQDSFALTPLGMHINGALVLVAAGRYARRRFLIASPGPQVVTCFGVLTIQEVVMRLTLVMVGYRDSWASLAGLRSLEILFTALLAPVMFALLRAVEKAMQRRGWRMAGAGSR